MTPPEPAMEGRATSTKSRRGGAPKGNRNAFKHGKYVGGRLCIKNIPEFRRIRRLERDARAIARGRAVQSHDTERSPDAVWDGKGLRRNLLREAKKHAEYCKTMSRLNEFQLNYMCARRDVLRTLSGEPKWFASYKMLLKGICSVFLQIDQTIAWADVPGVSNRGLYYYYWRLFCADLYETCCPDKREGAPSTQH
jgi:hypothetical protein